MIHTLARATSFRKPTSIRPHSKQFENFHAGVSRKTPTEYQKLILKPKDHFSKVCDFMNSLAIPRERHNKSCAFPHKCQCWLFLTHWSVSHSEHSKTDKRPATACISMHQHASACNGKQGHGKACNGLQRHAKACNGMQRHGKSTRCFASTGALQVHWVSLLADTTNFF